jgi:hypothetical protein
MKRCGFEGKKVLIIYREQNEIAHCVGVLEGNDSNYLFLETRDNSLAIPHSSIVKIKLFKEIRGGPMQ